MPPSSIFVSSPSPATKTTARTPQRGDDHARALPALSLSTFRANGLAGVARRRRRVTPSLRSSPAAADARAAFASTRQPRPCALRGSPSPLGPLWRARPERPWSRRRGQAAPPPPRTSPGPPWTGHPTPAPGPPWTDQSRADTWQARLVTPRRSGSFAKRPSAFVVINPPSKAVQNNKKYAPVFSVLAPAL